MSAATLVLLISTLVVRDTSIRTADLNTYFKSDTALYEVYPDVKPDRWGEIFLSVKQFEKSLAYGYPGEYITYGDLNGDGIEEAVVPFFTGGSIGSCSYAVLSKSARGIKTIYLASDCVNPFIENDTLNVIRGYNVGYEPNHMGQSSVTLKYRFHGEKIVRLDSQAYGNVRFADYAVQEFYKRLEAKNYEAAYRLLSAAYRRKHPYKKWLEGYKYTSSTSSYVGDINEKDTTVEVSVVAVDAPSSDSFTRYEGYWKLIWAGLEQGFLLDEPKIRNVK